MNTEALLRLADKLEGSGPYAETGPIPAERFNMYKWMNVFIPGGLRNFKIFKGRYIVHENQCGTVACACGWAATDPWFQERGLYVSPFNEILYFPSEENNDSLKDFAAIAHFFEISHESARYLFMPTAIRRQRPIDVAMQIRKFTNIPHVSPSRNPVTGV